MPGLACHPEKFYKYKVSKNQPVWKNQKIQTCDFLIHSQPGVYSIFEQCEKYHKSFGQAIICKKDKQSKYI